MMSRLKTMAEQWACYREHVVTGDTPPEQVEQLRLAFYGGVETLLQYTIHLASLDAITAVVLLEAIHLEMQDFHAEMLGLRRERHDA
jgi:hypothetical protein